LLTSPVTCIRRRLKFVPRGDMDGMAGAEHRAGSTHLGFRGLLGGEHAVASTGTGCFAVQGGADSRGWVAVQASDSVAVGHSDSCSWTEHADKRQTGSRAAEGLR